MEFLIPDLEHLGALVYWFVLLVSFAESLVFTGTFIPGTIVIVLTGGLAANHVHHFSLLVLFSTIGAMLGDAISYELGRRGEVHLERWPLFKKHIERARPHFHRHQRKSIVVGRFIGFTRPFLPFVAGVARMDRQSFYSIESLSALLWSFFYIGIGYVFGSAWHTHLMHYARVAFVIAAVLVLLIALTRIVRSIIVRKYL
jgi:undecaprenyl-diphosphatase